MIDISFLLTILFLSLAAIFPSGFSGLKIILLLIISFLSIIEINKRRIMFHRNIFIFLMLFLSYFSFSFLNSVIQNYGLNFRVFSEYLILPIIYPIAAYQVSKIDLTKRLSFIYLISLICILFNVLNFLYQLDIISLPLSDFMQGSVVVEEDYLLSRLPNQVTLIFLSPLVILLKPTKNILINLKPFLVFLLIVVAFFSGRRALQFSVMATLFISFFSYINILKDFLVITIRKNLLKKSDFLTYSIFIIFLISSIFVINKEYDIISLFNSFWATINVIFDSSDRSTSLRALQSERLIDEGLNKLFFGHGATANLPDLIRSNVGKWSYELRYHALFFQTGIFGIIFYLISFIWVIKINLHAHLCYIKKNNYFLVVGVSFLLFVFSAYSNPFYTHPLPWLISLSTYYNLYGNINFKQKS